MLKPIDPSAAFRTHRDPLPAEAVNNVFKVMHGFYGNLFLSKFASGEQTEDGEDSGVVSARQVWAHGLREFDGSTVKAALGRCMERHAEFPPSLPQFVALCAAAKPRAAYCPPVTAPALEMSQELREKRRNEALAKARELVERREQVEAAGLNPLKRAIADAVACAGGDEVAALLRLDRMLAPRVAA
jgi:hypothetical protein